MSHREVDLVEVMEHHVNGMNTVMEVKKNIVAGLAASLGIKLFGACARRIYEEDR